MIRSHGPRRHSRTSRWIRSRFAWQLIGRALATPASLICGRQFRRRDDAHRSTVGIRGERRADLDGRAPSGPGVRSPAALRSRTGVTVPRCAARRRRRSLVTASNHARRHRGPLWYPADHGTSHSEASARLRRARCERADRVRPSALGADRSERGRRAGARVAQRRARSPARRVRSSTRRWPVLGRHRGQPSCEPRDASMIRRTVRPSAEVDIREAADRHPAPPATSVRQARRETP